MKKKLRALQPSSCEYSHRLFARRRQPFPRVWSFCGSFVENVNSIALLCLCACIYNNTRLFWVYEQETVTASPAASRSTVAAFGWIHSRTVTL